MNEKTPDTAKIDPRIGKLFVGHGLFVDVGCGSGAALDSLGRRYEKKVGIDLSVARLATREVPPEDWSFVLADGGSRLPIATAAADVVFANQVIEHLYDPVRFAFEAYRVLKRGGVAVLTTPNIRYLKNLSEILVLGRGPRTGGGSTFDGPWDNGHLHYFTHSDIRRIFRRPGFSHVSSQALIGKHGVHWLRSGLDLISETWLVREFLSGNILLVATK